jgi:hypothetical protein
MWCYSVTALLLSQSLCVQINEFEAAHYFGPLTACAVNSKYTKVQYLHRQIISTEAFSIPALLYKQMLEN